MDQSQEVQTTTFGPKSIPANLEAEEAVLGSLLIDPDAIIKIASFLSPEDFYREKNGWIYQAVLDLHERREPADFVTLCDELERAGRLQEVGGAAYITQLINNTPTAVYVEHYAGIVERTATLRRLISAASQITALAYDEAQDVEEVVDRSEQLIFGVSERRIRSDLTPVRQVVGTVVDRIDFLHRHLGETLGVPSGFTKLDKLLGGFQKSDLIILAARPSVGKCIVSGSRLLDPQTGRLTTIDEIVSQRAGCLLTLDEHYRLKGARPSDFVDDGIKPVFRVRTALGREITTTASHPFLTINGWQPLAGLKVGQRIAIPRALPYFGCTEIPAEQVKILADHCREAVPSVVFELSRPLVALFLSLLLSSTDGIYQEEDGSVKLLYSTASHILARHVQHLLLRFGILAQLRHGQKLDRQGVQSPVPFYELVVTDQENISILLTAVGNTSSTDGATISRHFASFRAFCDPDGSCAFLERDSREMTRKTRKVSVATGCVQDVLACDTTYGPVDAYAADLAQSDVYWDAIQCIEPAGEQQVYDLTVDDTHNFVAEDMLVHNTALALNFAGNAAKKYAQRIAFFSLEMSSEQLVQRLLSSETGINQQRLRLGDIKDDEWLMLMEAAGVLSETLLYIDDTPAVSALELRTKARRMQAEHGLDLIIVDYLQLMRGDSRNDNRVQEISYITRSLKSLARELEVPLIALSQLSRAVEQRNDHKPQLSDLRESGSIEQDADVVMFIYREDMVKEDSERKNIADVIVAKHRNGPTDTVPLFFSRELTKFADLEMTRSALE